MKTIIHLTIATVVLFFIAIPAAIFVAQTMARVGKLLAGH